MAKQKLLRYQAAKNSPLYIDTDLHDPALFRGRWQEIFGNDHPLIVELACGRGEYTIGLARRHPECNYIGIDIKADRIYLGLQEAQKESLTNVRFLRIIAQHLDRRFGPGEISEIRIIHPDPKPRERDRRRRLTHERFWSMYQTVLSSQGTVRLKTDDSTLFDYSLQQAAVSGFLLRESTHDLEHSTIMGDICEISTHYGQLFIAQGRTLCYAQWDKNSMYSLSSN